MSMWKIMGLIVISHFLARNTMVTRLMDRSFEKGMGSFVMFPLFKFITGQKGFKNHWHLSVTKPKY